MTELLGSIGWGLLACGAITHVWHHQRLRTLLAMHLNHERLPAATLTGAEVALTIGIAAAFLADWPIIRWLSLAALALAIGFVVWIGRLLVTSSDLPCACSFSEGPTTVWSLGRALGVALVGLFALGGVGCDLETSERIAVLFVGWALASGIFVLPEALSWPDASRALLARVDAHTSTEPAP